ncbi:hypothetical protein B0H19DRAFT_1263941 [Mycena capillaripes]|nr:hypothetical protein B0H19DRAFT_1263941 [Mycena capillaripes]
MPLFESASQFQINGGTFIDHPGDINIHTTQRLDGDPLDALEFELTEGLDRQSLGVERNGRQAGPARMSPYDISRRPQILTSSQNLSLPFFDAESCSASTPSPPFPISQPGHEFESSSFTPAMEYPPPSPDPSGECHDLFRGSVDITAFEYPSIHLAPISGAPGEYDLIFPADNQSTFAPTSSALDLNLVSSTHTFPEETRFGTSLHRPVDASTSLVNHHDIHSATYWSTNLFLLPSPLGEPDHPFTGDFGNDESAVSAIHRAPWDGLPHEGKTSINGGTFIGGDFNHIQRHGEAGLHILYRAAAGDAIHDSEDRFPQPRCHPETRIKMLDALWNWTCGIEPKKNLNSEDHEREYIRSSPENTSSPILWLHGPAGAGKSAVAQSLCQKLEQEGRLGASFFFKRGHPSRGHAKRLFATIAYQLSLLCSDLNHYISQTMENNPSLVDKSISIQLQKLILGPFQQNTSTSTLPLVVVIDGLDECEDQSCQQEILRSIGHAFREQQPLRFLIASRPEPHIREIFTDTFNGIHCPVNIDQSTEDVRKYLLDEFARIHREHRDTMSAVPFPWPTPAVIDNLVEKSSGYFIYASTVIKFIDDKNFRPTKRLEVITGDEEPHFGLPFAALDLLYTQILSQVPAQPQLILVLAVIVAGFYLSAPRIEQLLELEPGDVRLALRGLHSVVNFPEPEYFSIYIHHASFSDFLQDSRRAGEFYVSSDQHRTDLARHILNAFSYKHDNASLNQSGHVAW